MELSEPYIVAMTTSGVYTQNQSIRCHWMGTYKPNTSVIDCIKYEKRGSEGLYAETHRKFVLAAEDLRMLFTKHTEIQQRASSRRTEETKLK